MRNIVLVRVIELFRGEGNRRDWSGYGIIVSRGN